LSNLITKDELYDNQEYEDIKEDVTAECSEHGEVLKLIIPRVVDGYTASVEGHIFVEFKEASVAQRAALSLSGRKFANRVVVVEYVSITISSV
jgi:splicing factor U2AF subunit